MENPTRYLNPVAAPKIKDIKAPLLSARFPQAKALNSAGTRPMTKTPSISQSVLKSVDHGSVATGVGPFDPKAQLRRKREPLRGLLLVFGRTACVYVL